MLYKSISKSDCNYPDKLSCMGSSSPETLYYIGNVDLLYKDSISVIGTRNPTKYSIQHEKKMVENFVENNLVVVSGLALGCDYIAHRATIDNGGETIAVMPSGVDTIVPRSNQKLADDILANDGLIVSQYPLGSRPKRHTYVERNKITASLGDSLYVVQCNAKSGTMHTVNFAKSYQKPIFAQDAFEFSGNRMILENGTAKKGSIETIMNSYR